MGSITLIKRHLLVGAITKEKLVYSAKSEPYI